MGSGAAGQIGARLDSDCRRNILHFLSGSTDLCFRGAQGDSTLHATCEPAAVCDPDMARGAALRGERKSGAVLRTGAGGMALARLVGLLDWPMPGRRARGGTSTLSTVPVSPPP